MDADTKTVYHDSEKADKTVSVADTHFDEGETTWFFSSCDGIVDLRRGIQASSSVGPGKSILPFELPERAGWELLSSHGRSK